MTDEPNQVATEFPWHLFQMPGEGTGLAIGRLPNRKKLCLYNLTSNVYEPLAYFRHEQAARFMLAWLMRLTAATYASSTNPSGQPSQPNQIEGE